MNKKCVRFLDTLGSMAALIALVIGITSLFADKYDLSFLPEGFLKELVDAGAAFEKAVDPVARLACEFKNMIYKTLSTETTTHQPVALYSLHFRRLSEIISGIEKTLLLDKVYNCKEVYAAFGTGAAITLFSSFFPGASTVASMSSRSAYYGVRTANAFYNLAARDDIPNPFQVLPWLLCDIMQV